jgi:hypothetical protein
MSRIVWTEPMDDALRALRKQGHPTRACADAIGVSEHPVERRLRELDLNQRLNRGRRPGHAIATEAPDA